MCLLSMYQTDNYIVYVLVTVGMKITIKMDAEYASINYTIHCSYRKP